MQTETHALAVTAMSSIFATENPISVEALQRMARFGSAVSYSVTTSTGEAEALNPCHVTVMTLPSVTTRSGDDTETEGADAELATHDAISTNNGSSALQRYLHILFVFWGN